MALLFREEFFSLFTLLAGVLGATSVQSVHIFSKNLRSRIRKFFFAAVPAVFFFFVLSERCFV